MRSSRFCQATFIVGCIWLTSVSYMPVFAEETAVHGRVMGQTEEGEHLGPVPGAKVEFLGRGGASLASAIADDAGYYRIAGLAAPQYAYRITASGFLDESAQRRLEVSVEGAHVLDFVLTKGDNPPEKSPDDKPNATPRKRPNGKPVRKPDDNPETKPNDDPAAIPNNNSDGDSGGTLHVRTWQEIDGKQSPLPNAVINLRLIEGGQRIVRWTTGPGRSVMYISAGNWRVSASTPGGATVVHPEPIQIAAGGSAEVEFTLPMPPPTPRAPLPAPPTNDGGKACFYGDVANAKRVVFVVDKSNSMRIEKFEEAAKELMHSVNYLTEQQQFYVIFFSDEMYPMFGAEAPDELIPASAANRERLQQYLGELPFHQGTRARPSMERALALKPDVIYLLGDGAFTDGTAKFLLGLQDNKVPICTVAFKSKEPGAKIMKQIADMHHGRFMYVP
jgi:hypothetical protein